MGIFTHNNLITTYFISGYILIFGQIINIYLGIYFSHPHLVNNPSYFVETHTDNTVGLCHNTKREKNKLKNKNQKKKKKKINEARIVRAMYTKSPNQGKKKSLILQ